MEEGSEETERRKEDERFMRLALQEARLAADEGEVPIGAVVVCDGKVISSAHNRRELDHDPSAHAEFRAMTEAAEVLGRWRLSGCTVYVTLEPCLMCAGLMVNSRIDRCVYGAPDPKGGALGTLYDVSHDPRLNHEFEVTSGVLADESAEILKEFFQARRAARKAEKRAARRSGTSGSPDSACPACPRGSDGPEPAA
ncbi:tRNA adenosine(34) deaminase TadA [Atopobiaceae bacterium HCP3S3_A4]